MKLTESVLRQMVKEELEAVLAEAEAGSKEDIKAWIVKLKPGGILAGHDYPHEPVARAVKELLGEPGVWGNCWIIGVQSG